MKSIVIVGGGFSGTVTAINLARLSSVPLQISIINQNRIPCRGIAYSTRNGSHLLNVVARNMSALADQPNHFVEWLGTRSEFLDVPVATLREKFVPRRVYGDYLHQLFQWYSGAHAAERKMRLEWIQDEVRDIFIDDHAHVALQGGQVLTADKVILAVGNQEPAPVRVQGLDPHSPKYIGNPWMGWEERLPSPDCDLLLVGTGLTMIDTFLSLKDLGWRGKIVAVSRNGLLPLSHFKGFDYPDLLDDSGATIGLRKMVRLFKKHFRTAQARDLNPAILVDKLRPHTQRIWQHLSVFEKRQFNRHLRTRWNVMRHRIAPDIHRQLLEAIAAGRLEILRGRLRNCEESGDGLKVEIAVKGGKRVVAAGALINCTGPQESYFPTGSALCHNLVSHGLIVPDEMNMGIKVDANFSVVNADGKSSEILFAMGSLLKGTLWETTAVPELRSQTFRLAEAVAGKLSDEKSAISEVVEDVLEYFI
jgi:uncharacterized NAD(P)/FAD-binding protein YdhS